MAAKEVYLFDDANNPLKVTGINLELFDAHTGVLLDAKPSKNRQLSLGPASTAWGEDLTFQPVAHPVDIYINDPTYVYPGNALESLNGRTTDRVDIDLMKLPTTAISSGSPATTLVALLTSIKGNRTWSRKEKQAVLNFVHNYMKLISKATIDSPEIPEGMESLFANWSESLNRLNIDPDMLRLEVPIFTTVK